MCMPYARINFIQKTYIEKSSGANSVQLEYIHMAIYVPYFFKYKPTFYVFKIRISLEMYQSHFAFQKLLKWNKFKGFDQVQFP